MTGGGWRQKPWTHSSRRWDDDETALRNVWMEAMSEQEWMPNGGQLKTSLLAALMVKFESSIDRYLLIMCTGKEMKRLA